MTNIKTNRKPRASMQPRARLKYGLAAWMLAACGSAAAAQPGAPVAADSADRGAGMRADTVALAAGMHAIRAEVAQTPAQRALGLMNRREMAPQDGMLFVFESQELHCFWMKSTLLPLTIAFLADDGRIVNLADMKPLDDRNHHCAKEPVRYALEMNQGWFAKRGLKPGFKLSGPPFRDRP